MIPLSYFHLAIFLTGDALKLDRDNWELVCTVSGLLALSGQEERKENHLQQFSGTQS